ncbi:hypothetical protein J4729_22465 [Leisingera sp. HS039]|uniref:hypothetical protein n=1 Tax=unclassified Leisingera TaxID=2614906 RepID=UPI0010712A14|nr:MULTISPECIES: hypothetical protein [unclassified Leisingera]MBQ4827282.1 hypothetical protein [Leisingera sp. HS039]QBR37525.1 hypothetical protein ETW23_16765 [Leisingera sp. NJS201]
MNQRFNDLQRTLFIAFDFFLLPRLQTGRRALSSSEKPQFPPGRCGGAVTGKRRSLPIAGNACGTLPWMALFYPWHPKKPQPAKGEPQ